MQYEAGGAAAVVTVGALFTSRFQGIGQHVDMSIIEATSGGTDRRSATLLAYQYSGEINPRIMSLEVGYPNGIYPCKDGYFCIQSGRAYWDRLVIMLGSPGFLKDQKWAAPAAQSDPALKEEFEAFYFAWLMERTKQECTQAGQVAGVPCAPVNTIEEVVNDPHFNVRGCFAEIDHPMTGKLKYVGRPSIMSETPWQVRRPAPLLGQHNEEVYGGLGYAKEDLVKLRQQGVI